MTQTNVQQELLFGVLALEMNFIGRDAFLQAVTAWVADRTLSLGNILQQKGAVNADDRKLLESLVNTYLRKHDNDAVKSLASASTIAAVREQLRDVPDTELQETLARAARSRATMVGVRSTLGKRFHILRPHARGGLGQVSVALDEELHREVALKEIQERFADDAECRARFQLEAEINGGLEHPGIVPVYGLGQDGSGRPFYAMRFIRGDSFQEAVDRFHREASSAAAGEQLLAFRKLLQQFVDVCEAVAYAHSRGVVHRDLKPSNIMLGSFGETLVVDWGLAKLLDSGKDSVARRVETLRPVSLQGSYTQMGSAIGTPQFMSPEQAAGRHDVLGTASDIYSLGATLYYVLTGQTAFEEGDVYQILHRVEHGLFPPPRNIQGSIDRTLEAICLKAMALRPEARYATAAALAEDIEHWLADEPVQACREPWPARLARWLRRHKAATAGLAGLVLAGVAALAVNRIMLGAEQQRTESARAEAVANFTQAEMLRRLAEDARNLEEERVIHLYIANGQRLLDEGNLFSSLVWFAEALKRQQARGHSAHETMNRMRLAAVLQRSPGLTQLLFHKGAVRHVAFSPDGRRLVTASEDHTAQLWSVDSGAALTSPLEHQDIVNRAEFNADGTRVITAGEDGTARLWDARRGEALTPPLAHDGPVRFASFAPDGQRVVTASTDGAARIWQTLSGRLLFKLPHPDKVWQARFSPDGTQVLTACADGSARLWDAATGQTIGSEMKHAKGVVSAQFSRDGRLVATASDDSTARVWETPTGKPAVPPLRHQRAVTDATLSRDGRWLASTSHDNTVKVWDLAAGGAQTADLHHVSAVTQAVFLADGAYLVTASDDNTARVWNVRTHKKVLPPLEHNGSVLHVAISPDSRLFATASDDNTVRVWDAGTVTAHMLTLQHKDAVFQAAFDPEGTRVVTASADQTARVWNAATGQPITPPLPHGGPVVCAAFSPDGLRVVTADSSGMAQVWDAVRGGPIGPPLRHAAAVNGAVFSPDGRRVATAGEDHCARLWDAATGKPSAGPLRHGGRVTDVAFSSDGGKVVTSSADKTACIWDADTGKALTPRLQHQRAVTQASFSPDGLWVATASDDQTARLWDARTGTPRGLELRHASAIKSVSFSSDGKRVLTAGADNTARIWDAVTGRLLVPPLEHKGTVQQAVFSPNALLAATASSDNTARVWDTATGEAVTPLLIHPGPGKLMSVAFSPDGQRVATACEDGTARLWLLAREQRSADHLVTLAELLCGDRIDPTGGLVPLPLDTIRSHWRKLRTP